MRSDATEKKSSSRWQEDPGNITDPRKVQQIHLLNNMYHRHWHQI